MVVGSLEVCRHFALPHHTMTIELLTMKILINGAPTTLPHICTIPEALAFAAIDLPPRSAIAVNERLVPRTALATYQLEEGDTLLLIRPTFGG
jgi:hypothetical protein